MDIIVVPVLLLIKAVIALAIVTVVTSVLLSWIVTANILNVRNEFVYAFISSISRIAEFMLRPVRERIPISVTGALDISPVILILLLSFLENIVNRILIRLM
ncbi:MAG: YggT family protein [Holosporaceae bacterium]|jgi:YggT family protein|nr:YggT family protein [Holosporaceae bacterium]